MVICGDLFSECRTIAWMTRTGRSPPLAPEVLEVEATPIERWGRSVGLKEAALLELIGYLTPQYLWSQPKPSGFKRRGFMLEQQQWHLWYQNAAKLLSWVHRHQFPVKIECILKEQVWPDKPVDGAQGDGGIGTSRVT